MKRLLLAGLCVWTMQAHAELPPVLEEAVSLELSGRLGEAADRYRAALTSVPALVQDEALADPLSVFTYSKIAHLSIDLGLGEDAWELSGRLLASSSEPANEEGTLVRVRLLRLQGKTADAKAVLADFAKAWPRVTPGARLQREISGAAAGPGTWVAAGKASLLPSPAEVLPVSLLLPERIQIGAFRDWNNALTVVNLLREKGWVPFTDVRTSGSEKLHVVYVISRQASVDRARLEAQGLLGQ